MEAVIEPSTNRRTQIQAVVYLLAAGVLLFFMTWSLALIFYGVAPHPLLLCAFVSAVGFAIAGALTFSDPVRGRIVALFACVVAAPLWIVWIIGIVPVHGAFYRLPIPHALVVGYLVLLGFVLFRPRRLPFSIVSMLLVCVAGAVVAWQTYQNRVSNGEYDRPGVACFHWVPDDSGSVTVQDDASNWIDERVKPILSAAKLSGTLKPSGGWGELSSANRMILLLKDKPPLDTRLYPPRHGVIVYAFDGKKWTKAPTDAPVYRLYFTIEEYDSRTMLYENTAGGKSGTQIWP